jgi:hypothetical protein
MAIVSSTAPVSPLRRWITRLSATPLCPPAVHSFSFSYLQVARLRVPGAHATGRWVV